MTQNIHGYCLNHNGYGYKYHWGGGEKSILQITTGMDKEKTLGYHFPSVNLDNEKKLTVYMPKSDEWNYKVAKDDM